MKNVLIIGYGQIGQSIARLYDSSYNLFTKDSTDALTNRGVRYEGEAMNELIKFYPFDVCHIAFTYSPDFEKEAAEYIKKFYPALTIIESTVPVGTTRRLIVKTGLPIVHSPVSGKHPNLTESIKTFKKLIGAIDKDTAARAISHYSTLGVDCMAYNSPEETELAKLLCTTYYGWNIMFMKNVHQLCEKLGVDFDNVYTKTNHNYNAGYTALKSPQFVRPVLKYMGNGIGGHCIWQNANILNDAEYLQEIVMHIIAEGWNPEVKKQEAEGKFCDAS